MGSVQDKFDASLRTNIARVHKTNRSFKELKALADKEPAAVAISIFHVLPTQMTELEEEAAGFGISLSARGDWEKILQKPGTIDGVCKVVGIADSYDHLRTAKARIELEMRNLAFAAVDEAEVCRRICDIYLETLKVVQASQVGLVAALQKRLPNNFESTATAITLSGYLIAHTSLWHHKRLRAAVDRLREEDESRFARLLKELPAQALEQWNKAPRYTGDLMDLRTEVAHRLAKQDAPSEEMNLAAFADCEKVLKRARDVGLPPREYELFKLRIVESPPGKTLLPLREAARRMGIAEGTAKSLWSRIKKSLAA